MTFRGSGLVFVFVLACAIGDSSLAIADDAGLAEQDSSRAQRSPEAVPTVGRMSGDVAMVRAEQRPRIAEDRSTDPRDDDGDSGRGIVCGPGNGDCCAANGTPGCNDATCCADVCSIDDACCSVEWTASCANLAASLCGPGACGGSVCPGAGDCCGPNGTPGCNDAACCEAVCAADSYCCDTDWDSTCGLNANTICADLCGGGDVCGDGTCQASEDCASCPQDCGACPTCPGAGDCCAVNGSPGCGDTSCCELVCAGNPACCTDTWDSQCVIDANILCHGLCGGPCGAECDHCWFGTINEGNCDPTWEDDGACDCGCQFADTLDCLTGSDCCVNNGTPGCDDSTCEGFVCSVTQDPSCCSAVWDDSCVALAEILCDVCAVEPPTCPGSGDCCIANGTPGCINGCCCDAVCAENPECCNTVWDAACAVAAETLCPGWCSPPDTGCPGDGGDCFAVHPSGNGGCDDEFCCSLVCSIDSVCCTGTWDSICVGEAEALCDCPPPSCPNGIIARAEPPVGWRDAGQPHEPGTPAVLQGVDTLVVSGPDGAASPECWSLCETTANTALHPTFGLNAITAVVSSGPGQYTITLAQPLTPGELTTLTYLATVPSSLTYAVLPGDVNGDGTTGPPDILAVIDSLNGVVPQPDSQADVDRSTVPGPPDILRVIDLLNGAGQYEVWFGATLQDTGECQ